MLEILITLYFFVKAWQMVDGILSIDTFDVNFLLNLLAVAPEMICEELISIIQDTYIHVYMLRFNVIKVEVNEGGLPKSEGPLVQVSLAKVHQSEGSFVRKIDVSMQNNPFPHFAILHLYIIEHNFHHTQMLSIWREKKS